MGSLFRKILVAYVAATSICLTFLALLQLVNATSVWSYIQVTCNTQGDVSASIFSIGYGISSNVQTDYYVEFTMSGDNPFVGIDIAWSGNKSEPAFGSALLTVFSSLFSMPNGTVERIFSWNDPYYSTFSPNISRTYSETYQCSYSLNLTSSLKEAKAKFANKVELTEAEQSNVGARIFFSTYGVDTIREEGQERHLEFLFQSSKANLMVFKMGVTIPSDADFVGKPTLNGVEMNKILKNVEGIVLVQPNEIAFYKGTVEWRVPPTPQIWETPPVSWIFSALTGGIIVSIPISYVSSKIWTYVQRPKISVDVLPKRDKDPKEPAIHPKIGIAFYHLVVNNSGKTAAYDSEIYLKFKDENAKEIFSLKGKWDRGPEPLGPLKKGGRADLWPALFPFGELVNVRPNIPETFCLLVKDNEDFVYAFGMPSYLQNFKHPAWKLPLGKFTAEVVIMSGNVKNVVATFLVENSGSNAISAKISKLNI
jgi:hypothetical protein